MSSKSDVAPANWMALVSAAPAIARAVSASAGSPGQSEGELDAFVQFVSEADTDAGATSVFGQLVADIGTLLATGVEPVSGDAYADGLEAARRAGAIVAVELEPDEAEAIRGWYLEAARRVAAAAREGGLLGIGGADVSAWERDTLRSIADALGSDAG